MSISFLAFIISLRKEESVVTVCDNGFFFLRIFLPLSINVVLLKLVHTNILYLSIDWNGIIYSLIWNYDKIFGIYV